MNVQDKRRTSIDILLRILFRALHAAQIVPAVLLPIVPTRRYRERLRLALRQYGATQEPVRQEELNADAR